MGITFAQGYAIHRPEPLDALMADQRICAES
jgi:EAL domain-containing protein (putative c-di-GMP-specific phosphodiesterase class I)